MAHFVKAPGSIFVAESAPTLMDQKRMQHSWKFFAMFSNYSYHSVNGANIMHHGSKAVNIKEHRKKLVSHFLLLLLF